METKEEFVYSTDYLAKVHSVDVENKEDKEKKITIKKTTKTKSKTKTNS